MLNSCYFQYQPETSYRIFTRALFNKDIATGEEDTYTNGEAYQSEGPSDTWAYQNEDPPDPIHFCYTLDPYTLCSEKQIESIINGTALIQNYIVVDQNSTTLFPGVVGNGTSPANGTATGGGDGGYASGSAATPQQTANGATMASAGWLLHTLVVGQVVALLQ